MHGLIKHMFMNLLVRFPVYLGKDLADCLEIMSILADLALLVPVLR